MTRQRIIKPGTTWALSRRTTRRHYLLNPDKKGEMEQLFWYALGVAQHETGVELHAACMMSTHTHLVLTDEWGQLPRFLQRFHRLLALSVKAFRGWTAEVFDKRSTGAHELLTTGAIVQSLAYLMANPVEAKAVRYAKDWPGVQTLPQHLGRRVVRVKRPKYFYDPNNPRWPEEVEVRLTLPQALAEEGPERARRSVAAHLADAERKALSAVKASTGTFRGISKVLAQSFRKRATSWEEFGALNPQFAAGGDREARREAVAALKSFQKAYREALAKWRGGDRTAVFPAGTWWMVQFHGAAVAAPT